jgi:hypothetical protein
MRCYGKPKKSTGLFDVRDSKRKSLLRHGHTCTCVALTRHTPVLGTPHGQNAVFTRQGLEK